MFFTCINFFHSSLLQMVLFTFYLSRFISTGVLYDLSKFYKQARCYILELLSWPMSLNRWALFVEDLLLTYSVKPKRETNDQYLSFHFIQRTHSSSIYNLSSLSRTGSMKMLFKTHFRYWHINLVQAKRKEGWADCSLRYDRRQSCQIKLCF